MYIVHEGVHVSVFVLCYISRLGGPEWAQSLILLRTYEYLVKVNLLNFHYVQYILLQNVLHTHCMSRILQ